MIGFACDSLKYMLFLTLGVVFCFGRLLLGIQGVSELIKRIAFLKGLIPDPTKKQGVKTPEEELAEFLLQKEVAAREAAQAGALK